MPGLVPTQVRAMCLTDRSLRPGAIGVRRGSSRRDRQVLPRLDLLEGRMLLSSYSVTSNADTDTAGTLLYAIDQLDASSASSTRSPLRFRQPTAPSS